MASSKKYHEEVLVPAEIIVLSKQLPNKVFCNLRPDQRPDQISVEEFRFRKSTEYSDGQTIDYNFWRFLKQITEPTMVVILYQGYGPDVSSVVAELKPIVCWAEVEFPRLDFRKPENWNHCINLWGSFVLAIARVEGITPSSVLDDPNAEQFTKIASQYGVEVHLPRETLAGSQKRETVAPAHEMMTPIVRVPTISVRERGNGDEKRNKVCIQWFGEANCVLPNDAQFLFESTASPEAPHWCDEPEAFKVIFIGPVRKWPRQDIVQQVADIVANGDLDRSIVWMVSSKFPQHHPTATYAPASLMTPVVLLGDPDCGIIRPRHYCDMEVLASENAAARQGMSLAERLLENPDLELPSEVLPWQDEWPVCKECSSLEHSHSKKPAVPNGGDCQDLIHLCISCGRRWWQFNNHFHLWKHVTSKAEWNILRRSAILAEAGFAIPEQ